MPSTILDRYDAENVTHTIEGYRIPHPGEAPESAFARAKTEAIHHLREYITKVETMGFEQFQSVRH